MISCRGIQGVICAEIIGTNGFYIMWLFFLLSYSYFLLYCLTGFFLIFRELVNFYERKTRLRPTS